MCFDDLFRNVVLTRREADFVESADALRRLCRLNPESLQEVDGWLAPFQRFWSAHEMPSYAISTTLINRHQ
jgi:hypothetical protein